MEKTTIYRVIEEVGNKLSVQDVPAYVFINPSNDLKVWLLFPDSSEYATSLYLSEFEEDDYFLTKKEAIQEIENRRNQKDEFYKLCIDFIENCKKYNEPNPFIEIGKHQIRKSNSLFVQKMTDPIYKHFANYHLETHGYLPDVCKELLAKLKKS